jgi:hypothetical protein
MCIFQPPSRRRPAQSVHSDAKLRIVQTCAALVDAGGMADQGLVSGGYAKRDESRIPHRCSHGLLAGGEAPEVGLQRIDPCEIGARIMIAAFRAVEKVKAVPHVQIAGPGAAQMDHGG